MVGHNLGDARQPREGSGSGVLRVSTQHGRGEGDRVGVPRDRVVQLGLRRSARSLRRGGGDGGTVAGEDPFEHLGRGQRTVVGRAGQGVCLIGAEDEVGVVLDATAGEHRVEQLPVLRAGDDAVDDVGGDALGGVHRGGVAELDVGGDVVRGQRRVEPRGEVSHGQAAVRAHSLDLPAVAVLDPVRAAHAEPSIVAAADHHVVDVGRAAIRERRGCPAGPRAAWARRFSSRTSSRVGASIRQSRPPARSRCHASNTSSTEPSTSPT